MPFAIGARFLYRTLKSASGFNLRLPKLAGGRRCRRRKDDMTVIDPFLDRSQNSAGMRPEGRELAMLRHDIRGALMGVMGAVGQMETATLDTEARRRSSASPPRRGRSPAWSAALWATSPSPPIRMCPRSSTSSASSIRCGAATLRRPPSAGWVSWSRPAGSVPAALRTDALALARILDNLVGNAIKFSDFGTVRLTACARAPTAAIVFRVLDEGPGLAAEAAWRLPAGTGQGLGLEIVRTLADRLGAETTIGNRARRWRRGGAAPSRVRCGRRGRWPPALPVNDLAGLRMLLAEDNPTNQMVASQMLRSLKAEIIVCSDGVEALERFEAERVDLVVVDIEMPRLSGLDVIRAIRARSDARAQVPIVALTAYAMREHRERIAAAGANGLISKPITSVESLGRGLAAHVARVRSAVAPPPDEEARAGDADPVIDRAIYDALCEAIGADTMAELLDKVVADLLAAQAGTRGGARWRRVARRSARPRTSSSRSPARSARCGCRTARAT